SAIAPPQTAIANAAVFLKQATQPGDNEKQGRRFHTDELPARELPGQLQQGARSTTAKIDEAQRRLQLAQALLQTLLRLVPAQIERHPLTQTVPVDQQQQHKAQQKQPGRQIGALHQQQRRQERQV